MSLVNWTALTSLAQLETHQQACLNIIIKISNKSNYFPLSVIQHICRNMWQKEQQYSKSIICFVKDTLQLSQENVFRGEMSREVLQ